MRLRLTFPVVAFAVVVLAVGCAGPNEYSRGKSLADRGQELYGKGEKEKAQEVYREAIPELEAAAAKGLGGAECLYYLGVARYRTGEKDKGVEALQASIEKKPDYMWPRFELGKIYLEDKEYDSAIAQLAKAAEIDPDYDWAWHMLGQAYAAKGEDDKAIEALEKSKVANPGNEFTRIALARLYRKTGRKDEAIAAFEWYLANGTVPAFKTEAKKALDQMKPPAPGIRDVKKPAGDGA